MPLVTTDMGTIEVAEWGAGNTEVVLLHASATGPHTLSGLAKLLLDGSRRISAPAFAGYGKTTVTEPPGISRVQINRQIADEVLEKCKGLRTILFGHSMGGLVALLAAIERERQGEPLEAVVLYEPILIDLLDPSRPDHAEVQNWDRAVIQRLAESIRSGVPESGVRGFVEAWNETDWLALPKAARQHLVASAGNLARETIAVSYQALEPAKISAFRTPVLLMRGSQSPELVRFVTQASLDLLPNSELSVLGGCGHMGPVLNARAVAESVDSFLRHTKIESTVLSWRRD